MAPSFFFLFFLHFLLIFSCVVRLPGDECYFSDGEPAIFDPAVYYGHSEADFGIMNMFGGVTSEFYDAYFEVSECVLTQVSTVQM